MSKRGSGAGDHFDGAAGETKTQGPDRRLARPVEHVVNRRRDEVLLKLVLEGDHKVELLV